MKLSLYVILLSLFCSTIGYSLPFSGRFDHYTIKDGFTSHYVNYLLQDSKGFIWVASNNGLNRYDGYNVTVFKHDVADSSSLSNNWVSCLLEDSNGNLWIGTSGGGLNLYDRQSATFKRFINNPNNLSSISNNYIDCLYEDVHKNIWIGTRGGGLCKLNTKDFSFSCISNERNCKLCLSSNAIIALTGDEKGNLWIGHETTGIDYYDITAQTITAPIQYCDKPYCLPSSFIRGLFLEDSTKLWIGTDNGFSLYNPQTGDIRTWKQNPQNDSSISSSYIHRIEKGDDGNLWLASNGGGVNYYDKSKDIFLHIKASINKEYGLNSNNISNLMIDHSRNLWIATRSGGVNKYDLKKLMFKHWGTDPLDTNTLVHHEVRALHQDEDGTIWVGTNDGISHFNRETNVFRNYRKDFTYKEDESAARVRSIFRSRNNTLLITTQSGGLYKYDEKKDRFLLDTFYINHPNSKHLSQLRHIYEGDDNVFWMGTTSGGVLRYDYTNKTIDRYIKKGDIASLVSENKINVIYPKSKNELWFATDVGLVLFNTDTHQYQTWKKDDNNSNSISGNKIRAFHAYNDSILWIGTRDGLSIYNHKANTFTNYHTSDGLPSEVIFGIIPDKNNNIWLTTTNGLCRVDPVTMEFTSIRIPQNNFLDMGGHCKSINDEIIVGGTEGLTIFHPDDIVLNPYKPNVVFTNCKIKNLASISKGISELDSLFLTYKQNSFTFEFSALDFSNPSMNQYKYYLEGFNNEWVEHGNKHDVTFTNLDPGEYTLYIKGSNNDGIWNETPATIYIKISPPWWDTSIFKILLILGILILIRYLSTYRIITLKKQKKELELKVAEKTQDLLVAKDSAEAASNAKSNFLSNMSHELRTPLSAIMGYSQMLVKEENLSKKQKSNISTIYSSGEHLLSLINDVLDLGKIEANKIELFPQSFNLKELFKNVVNIISIKANAKNVTFSFSASPNIPEYVTGDEKRIKQVILNVLDNAIKYTHKGEILLHIEGANDYPELIKITVSDTGEGIPSDKLDEIFNAFSQVSINRNFIEGAGLGLSITNKLIRLMNGKISVESTVGEGSTFFIELPLPVGDGTGTEKTDEYLKITGYNGEKQSILIAEDDESNAKLIKDLLEPLGIYVEVAYNGSEALNKMNDNIPDMLILDYLMPEKNGLTVLEEIRASEKLHTIKIIGISASILDDDVQNKFTNQCDFFIVKPINQTVLFETIQELLPIEWLICEIRADEGVNKQTDQLVVPDKQVITEIEKYISLGEFYQVEEILEKINTEGRYNVFCDQLNQYVKRFDDEGLITYLNNLS